MLKKNNNRMEINMPLEKGITVYSKSSCNFCDKVKAILYDSETFPFEEYSENTNSSFTPFVVVNCDAYLENKETFLSFIETLAKKEWKTFPMIFWDGQFIGGYKELMTEIPKRLKLF